MALSKITNLGTLTENIVFQNTKGIDFSATGGATGANTTETTEIFEDYEEGFWTPTISSGWSSFTTDFLKASYVKIGHMCYVTCSMRFSGTNASATVVIDGLPYASQSNANGYASGTGAIGYANMFTVVNNTVSTVYVVQNASRIQMYTMLGASVNSNADASNRWLEFSAAYPTV
tara:strand:- start:177 stop:701 length:525 start_codon:yes stop_codon:yes gene_type:complete